jgi:hypothetical protein
LRDTAQATSILALIGQGCHRISEIAARMGKPVTSLAWPLERLIEMELVVRETPFGTSVRSSKRTLYRIADPFLRFWFRFVQPDRSRLEARQTAAVEKDIASRFPHHAGEIWEELARESVPVLDCFGKTWGPAAAGGGPAWIANRSKSISWPRVKIKTPSSSGRSSGHRRTIRPACSRNWNGRWKDFHLSRGGRSSRRYGSRRRSGGR